MALFTFNPETDELTLLEENERDKSYSSPEDQIAMEMINYFLKNFGCFNVPTQFIKALNYWIGAPEDKLQEKWTTYQISTAGYLINQDMCENRKLRQGKQTVHEAYGVPNTINAILYAVLIEFSIKALETKTLIPQHLALYASNNDLHTLLAHGHICPTEELYYKICGNRGAFLSFSHQVIFLQQVYGTDKIDLTKLVRKIEIFLTIVDECRRVAVNNTEDIQAVHFSFPIMYAINKNKKDGELLVRIMQERPQNEAVLKYALSIVRNSGCFEYARKQLRLLKKEIVEENSKLSRNALMDSFFNDYLDVPPEFEDVTWKLS
ncbi:hypothetical protein ILUMI_21129 [Ignelater luminosus]|uniref:Uncharacterized protein n=1 Tax=Ignelater luminosus TaxID=2038154 RepID=A0A8K0G457_IGNLU|nr:hypothetical protein ILUMI_21129 [Ignelater luminosus]